MTTYTPLWCKSNYSFLEGASHPQELVTRAHDYGLPAIAITDRNGLYGMVRAHKRAQELKMHLIVGAELTLSDDSSIMLLAMNRDGYAGLCKLISLGQLRTPKGEFSIDWQDVADHNANLIALWGGSQSLLHRNTAPAHQADLLRKAFDDRLYALITRHHEPADAYHEHQLRERARTYDIPTVAAIETLYHTPERRDLQDVLTCIRHGVTLSKAGTLLHPNAHHALLEPDTFLQRYQDDPDSITRTLEITNRCTFSLSDIRYRYPSERLPDGTTSSGHLRALTQQGIRTRYPDGPPEAVQLQIEKELGVIHELDYDGYFLTMYEVVRFCNEHNILCQGRGSAANSAVCYCLGITAVDPVRMGLLFERFLSKERAEPPDIDLDIEHDRREEVIQHVYKKYGRSHAAMTANCVRYRGRSAIREVGKALGLKETDIARMAKMLSLYESPDIETLKEAGIDPERPLHQHLLRLATEIQNFPRHLSIHPGGFLLGHEPVHTLVPVENATMPDRTVIQWDKDDLEDLGLFKVDLLGLGALNVVHRAFDLIKTHTGKEWTMATIPPRDEPTFEMIRNSDTVGVFQIESRAQMAMLGRLRPRNYYDLVIEISIVRPGPITGGMVHPFLRRRNGEEPVIYPHPSLEPILKKTLGIPLFQEQVMQLAVVAADYTPGEADQLRRDMAAWRKHGQIEQHREKLITRMQAKGIAYEFADRVFEQIRGFGEYGFPESHAASFALIAYATSWLKCHHPAAFLCALLNAQPMGFYSPATLVDDAKRHGVTIGPIDIHQSQWDCTLETAPGGFGVRMGLRYVKGLSGKDGQAILHARRSGAFNSIRDLRHRVDLSSDTVNRLAECGAFHCFTNNRREALWDTYVQATAAADTFDLPDKEQTPQFTALDPLERIEWDYDSSFHSAHGHPLAELREQLTANDLPDAIGLHAMKTGTPARYAGIVICRQRPGTANGVVFMTLEDETGFVNLIIRERVYLTYRLIARTQSFLGVTGKIQNESNTVHLLVDELWIPDFQEQPDPRKSRDFH